MREPDTTVTVEELVRQEWWRAFVRRHPELVVRREIVRDEQRVAAEYNRLLNTCYFVRLHEWLKREKATAARCGRVRPRIWNADETQMVPDGGRRSSVGMTGVTPTRAVNSQIPHITVLPLVNADGEKGKPLILSKQLLGMSPQLAASHTRTPFATRVTENGWNDGDTMELWMKEVFLPTVERARAAARTAVGEDAASARHLLVLDGHSSHVNVVVARLAVNANVDILMFPANMTHKLQPLDLAGLKSFKDGFHNRYRATQNGRSYAFMRDSGLLLEAIINAYHSDLTPKSIRSGFDLAGISPFAPERALTGVGGWGTCYLRMAMRRHFVRAHNSRALCNPAMSCVCRTDLLARCAHRSRQIRGWSIGLSQLARWPRKTPQRRQRRQSPQAGARRRRRKPLASRLSRSGLIRRVLRSWRASEHEASTWSKWP